MVQDHLLHKSIFRSHLQTFLSLSYIPVAIYILQKQTDKRSTVFKAVQCHAHGLSIRALRFSYNNAMLMRWYVKKLNEPSHVALTLQFSLRHHRFPKPLSADMHWSTVNKAPVWESTCLSPSIFRMVMHPAAFKPCKPRCNTNQCQRNPPGKASPIATFLLICGNIFSNTQWWNRNLC